MIPEQVKHFFEHQMFNIDEAKEKLRKEWRESMKMPRKKKKEIRKRIRFEWALLCYYDDEIMKNIRSLL